MALRALIYARTSNDDPEEKRRTDTPKGSYSIKLQLQECRDYCASRGYEIVGEYQDANFSSRTYPVGCDLADKDPDFQEYAEKHIRTKSHRLRPGLAELLPRLADADVVVLREDFRLMRPVGMSYLGNFIYGKLRDAHVRIDSIHDGIMDPSDWMHKLMRDVKNTFASEDLDGKLAASHASLKAKRDEGWLYHCPSFYGYSSLGPQRIVKVPEQIKIVQEIFDRFVSGTALHTIIRDLNERGVPTQTGEGTWVHHTVKRMLSRPYYAGYQYNNDKRLIKSLPFDGLECVSLANWRRAQKLLGLHSKRYNSKSRKTTHPLTGLLRCGYCGGRMGIRYNDINVGKKKKRISAYHCIDATLNQMKSTSNLGCRRTRITEYALPPYVDRTGSEYGRYGIIEALWPIARGNAVREALKTATDNHPLEEERAKLSLEADHLMMRENQLFEMHAEGTLRERQLEKGINEINAKVAEVQSRLAKIDSEMEEASYLAVTRNDVDAAINNPDLLQILFRLSILQVDVYAYHVLVELVNGGTFVIERTPIASSRAMPYVASWSDGDQLHPFLEMWRSDMPMDDPLADLDNAPDQGWRDILVYHYKYTNMHLATAPMLELSNQTILYEDERLVVAAWGQNPAPQQYAKVVRKRKKTLNELPEWVTLPPAIAEWYAERGLEPWQDFSRDMAEERKE